MYEDVIREIIQYHNLWWRWPVVGVVMGFATWLALSSRIQAHARSALEKILFFVEPFLPSRMLIIGKRVYYDDEYEVIKGQDGYHIRTAYGEHYVSKTDPDEVVIVRSALNARGPEGVDSPFSMAWRWIVAASILVYGVTLGLLSAWMDPRIQALQWLQALGLEVPEDATIKIMAERSQAIVFAAVFMALALAWWLANILRFTTRGIRVAKFVELGISSSTIEVVPAVEPDSPASVFSVIGSLVRRGVRLELSDNARVLLEELARKMKTDIAAVVQLLNRAALADIWRREIGDQMKHYLDIKRAAEAECMLKARGITPRIISNMGKIAVLALVGGLVLGALGGYALGAIYGKPSVHRVNINTTAPGHAPGAPAPQPSPAPPAPAPNTSAVTPAPPPPPPTGPAGG